MSNLIEALSGWRQHVLAYIIRTAPKHLVGRAGLRLYRTIIAALTMDRQELIRYCEERGHLWEIDEGTIFEMLPPENTGVPARFEGLIGEHEIEPNFVCEITDARLVGPWAIPVTPSGKIISEPYGPMFHTILRRTFMHDGLISTLRALWSSRSPPDERDLSGPLFHLVARHGYDYDEPNYGHWINEHLPQLQACDWWRKHRDPDLKILVNETDAAWLFELLEIYGYSADDIVIWRGQFDVVNRLIMAKLNWIHSSSIRMNPLGKQWARSTALQNIECDPEQNYPKRIFMSRQNAGRRKITNFNAVKKKLSQNNFQIIEPENLSMQEEMCICSQAEIIAGVQGSNLAGIIFSSESIIIEFSSVYVPIFHMMANELKLDHFSIYNEKVQSSGNVQKNVKIPVKLFETILLDVEGLLK